MKFTRFLKNERNSLEHMLITDGLALYKIGDGIPVLLVPYPHSSGYCSMSENPLVEILNEQGFSVLTFDLPGIYKSARKASVTLQEILECINELLDYFKITEKIMVVGHSQSAFCSIAYAIEFPQMVSNMILIGAVSGWNMVSKTSIHKQLSCFTKDYWKIIYWGTRKMLNLSNLKIHKKLDNLVFCHSFYNKSFFDVIPIEDSDNRKPEPIRAKWMVNLRKYNYDYSNRLYEINIPVLICAGKYDVQTPIIANMELKQKISNSRIEIFEKSGHLPFIEEQEKFKKIINLWIKENSCLPEPQNN